MVLKRRPNWTAFDLLLTRATDHICADGGLDRSAVARALSMRLDALRAAAKRLKPIEPRSKEKLSSGLKVFVVKRLGTPNLEVFAGTMQEADERFRLLGGARVTYVSRGTAWDSVWHDAQEVGIDLGPLTASTFEG
jgi:hypothetical protein